MESLPGDKCRATIINEVDIKGSIPNWIIKMGNTNAA